MPPSFFGSTSAVGRHPTKRQFRALFVSRARARLVARHYEDQGGNAMKLPRRAFLRLASGVAALPIVWRIARAQSYPSRPVRVIVASAAGGGNDIAARLIGQWLSEHFGQQFVVENRPGA